MVAGAVYFYEKINEVFDAAKRNAPSVIFIDDTDVIFEGDAESRLYRYLLTMLNCGSRQGRRTGKRAPRSGVRSCQSCLSRSAQPTSACWHRPAAA
jgi:ATPase family associated with various cellular activities (AAA)